jgi:hypothetical protein
MPVVELMDGSLSVAARLNKARYFISHNKDVLEQLTLQLKYELIWKPEVISLANCPCYQVTLTFIREERLSRAKSYFFFKQIIRFFL